MREVCYPQYGRVHFVLTDQGWAPHPSCATRSRASDHGTVASFPQCLAGGGVVSFFAACSPADEILFVGSLHPCITVSAGVTPEVYLAPLDEILAAAEQAQRGIVTHAERAALLAIRGVVADAVGHPGRDAALKAIDRLGRPSKA